MPNNVGASFQKKVNSMSHFEFDLRTDNQQWSRMIYKAIKGGGRVQPKLQLTFLVRSLPRDTEIRVIQSKINLFIKEELLGKGEMIETGPTLYDSFDAYLNYEVLIS